MTSEEEIAQQAVEAYTSVAADIVGPMAILLPMSLMYGIYIIIFGLCINVLWQRRDSPASRAYTRWIIALFVLETIYVASNVWVQVDQAVIGFNAVKTQDYIPLFKSITGTSPYDRIWWIIRQAGRLVGRDVYSRYKIFVATILETGLIYSSTLLVTVISGSLTDPQQKGLAPFSLWSIATPLSAIAPTLIVVRIAYGQSVDSVQQMVSTLQFAQGGNISTQQRSAAARNTLDIRQSLAGAEGRDTMERLEMGRSTSNVAGDAVRG
ncbi:hypothetical protein PQX77_008944 [Marasmius sp. AFHP31]|nr:hypothetical protein PQX77_008944 [Marasmius sp. AFHP31]